MSLPAFQRDVAEFVGAHGLQTRPELRLLDLASEVGELARQFLKDTRHGTERFSPGREWTGELGDAFFSLVCLANSTGTNLVEALQGALAKYQQRTSATGEPSSGR